MVYLHKNEEQFRNAVKLDYDTLTMQLLGEAVPYETVVTAVLEIAETHIFEQ